MIFPFPRRPVPASALVSSVAALGVPVAGQFFFPESVADYEVMLWLLALVPAFLLAYHRGWRGVATALATGMAFISTMQVLLLLLGRGMDNWPLFVGVLIFYVGISLGIGWVTELLHRAREEAERMAFTDALTGLPNRRLCDLFLETEFAAAQRGRPLVLAVFDLDHFKSYNDAHGHATGDEALQAFGCVLGEQTRRMNISARYGGEEFLSIVSEADIPGALVFVERVRTALASVEVPGGPLTASVGVAAYQPEMRSPLDLYAAADRALYEAKKRGRNQIHVSQLAGTARPHALAG